MAKAADTQHTSLFTRENRRKVRMLALGATIAVTVFLLWQSDEPPGTLNTDAQQLRGDAEPDGFVINGNYTSYDETGHRKIVFTSPRIEQFEEGNLATMKSPNAQMFSNTETDPWILEAENGSLQQDEDLLKLTGNVHVERTIGDREATLMTQSLTLDNKEGMVYTDEPVKIIDKAGTTRATGMKAWIDDRILELNSQVEGRYETVN